MKTNLFSLLLVVACTTQLPKDPEEYLAPRASSAEASAELLETTPKNSPEYPALLMRSCEALEQDYKREFLRFMKASDKLYQSPPNKEELTKEKEQAERSSE